MTLPRPDVTGREVRPPDAPLDPSVRRQPCEPDPVKYPPRAWPDAMRVPNILLALVAAVLLAMAGAGLLARAEPESTRIAQAVQNPVIFPAGTVLHVTNFSALAQFTVDPPGAQLVGAFHADHSMWIMAWTNGTPMPMCPIALGYVGPPMNASYNESLKPETWTLSEVCGGLGNLTVTQTIELVYGSGGAGTGTGSDGRGDGTIVRTASGPSLVSTAWSPLLVLAVAASVLLVAGIGLVARRKAHPGPRR